MNLTKAEAIEAFHAKPIEVGDKLTLFKLAAYGRNSYAEAGLATKDTDYKTYCVIEVGADGKYKVNCSDVNYGAFWTLPEYIAKKNDHHIGADPFPRVAWNSKLEIISFDLDCILNGRLFRDKIDIFKTSDGQEIGVGEVTFDPMIIDTEGNEIGYQRDLCWTLEQKQLLIDSVYHNLDCGKIVVRRRSYAWVEKRIWAGKIKHTAYNDVVDGKQRLTTLKDFLENKFPDAYGNYFRDLSNAAQRKFLNCRTFTYGELGEECSDADVQGIFLNVNFTGTPMSIDHIEFVKAIKVKA